MNWIITPDKYLTSDETKQLRKACDERATIAKSAFRDKIWSLSGHCSLLVINVSPSRYIRKIRLDRAKQLLVRKDGNVTETAYKVAFSSSSYFTKCYKEEFDKVRLESENV